MTLRTDTPVKVEVDYLGCTVCATLIALGEQERQGALARLLDTQLEGAGLAAQPKVFIARAAYAEEVMVSIDGLEPALDTAEPGWQARVPYPIRVAIGATMERFSSPVVSLLDGDEKKG